MQPSAANRPSNAIPAGMLNPGAGAGGAAEGSALIAVAAAEVTGGHGVVAGTHAAGTALAVAVPVTLPALKSASVSVYTLLMQRSICVALAASGGLDRLQLSDGNKVSLTPETLLNATLPVLTTLKL